MANYNFSRGDRLAILGAVLAWALSGLPPARAQPATPLRERALLDADWRFHRGEFAADQQPTAPSFDDQDWQGIHLPHDYGLDGAYSQSNQRNHGYLPTEVGWYRKHLVISAADRDKILRLDFDGVFRDSEVWLNGQYLGRHASGYTPFAYDITKLAKLGADNVIAVRVDPREFEGWWYEGAGIYRHVYLIALSPLHVAPWGTYVISTVPGGDHGASAEASLTIQTTLENNGAAAPCRIVSDVVGPDGKTVASLQSEATAVAAGEHTITQEAKLLHPQLWSLAAPQLYHLRTTVVQNGQPVDATETTFGIRTIRFDPNHGFFLNGQHVEIQGTASHQDFAAVGIAVPDSLQAWRIAQLKKIGGNAWRTAHNPPNEALLDACDRLGLLVMDENRHIGMDESYVIRNPHGPKRRDFSDLTTMIQRDRHHPSIILWSMCNEEGLQGTPEGGSVVAAMMQVARRYDDTRPITSAMNGGWLTQGIADVEDVVGVNYNIEKYDAIHQRHPDKAMFGSECTNQKTTRGEYTDNPAAGLRSNFDLSDQGWRAVAERPFMAGSFTWTAFDYRGEPNPYGWPDISNNTGLMDTCGFPKDKYYYFESCWSDQPMVHIVPGAWNWPGQEGRPIRVLAFSNARQVELWLNGRSLGTKAVPPGAYAEWQVPYQPGELQAKAYTDGKIVATDDVATTGVPARIELSADRVALHADGEDAVVIRASIVDANGRVVPTAANRVSFQLAGGGQILGVGNGDPADHDTDKADQRNAFHGRCIVVIQAGSQPAALRLTATSPGLPAAQQDFGVE